MGTITRGAKAGGGTNFNSGQIIDPAEVNTDFNTLYTEANGNLDDGNIETGTIPGAKSLRFTEISDPASPSSNDGLLYAKDVGGTTTLAFKDSAGTVTVLSGSTPRSYLAGLGTVQAADADHDLTIAVGSARDSTNAVDLVLTAALTKRLDATWAVGDTNGGLDTGAIANATWYALWLIKRSDTGVVDALFSASFSAPTMPTDYDYKRRIGAVLTDGSAAILDYTQVGDHFLWTTPILDLNADVTEAATLRTLSVPPVSVEVQINVKVDWTTGDQVLYVSSPDQADVAPSLTAAPLAQVLGPGTGSIIGVGSLRVRTNTASRVRTRAIGTFDAFSIATIGWQDRRGRDD